MASQLGVSEQSCNECKRRKGKCDRMLPECTSCSRNRRHCLYEKATGRTPLTRKNLTEAEEKLRRAEMRIRVAERRAHAAEEKLSVLLQNKDVVDGLPPSELEPTQFPSYSENYDFGNEYPNVVVNAPGSSNTPYTARSDDSVHSGYNQNTNYQFSNQQTDEIGTGLPEDPPCDRDDFSWDETSRRGLNTQVGGTDPRYQSSHVKDEDDIVDGMASLKVEDQGYLGVASGVAMLRLLLPEEENKSRRKMNAKSPLQHPRKPLSYNELGLAGIDLDAAIDAYFGLYHLQYPLVHEATFRAQYALLIPRPHDSTFDALVYMIGAIGLYTTAINEQTDDDLKLFEAAKLNVSIEMLEKGNTTLVQVLVLMANYLQKRGKPNSGYNYLGLALHIAMTLGLHKEFANWKLSPLIVENRRRIWYTLYNLYVGALITFGRPWSWPEKGIDLALPLNIHDRDLNNMSTSLPPNEKEVTTYTFLLAQSRFHQLSAGIYTRIISMQYPSAHELLQLDDELVSKWTSSLGSWYTEDAKVPSQYALGHGIIFWRMRNFRIIIYRPFVIRSTLSAAKHAGGNPTLSQAEARAVDRCLQEAKATITSIRKYWDVGVHNSQTAWYALYFLFHASLIPCLCLRNQPNAPQSADWRDQITQSISVMSEMVTINPSSVQCYSVIMRLCGQFLDLPVAIPRAIPLELGGECAQRQMNNVYSMMWPNAAPTSADMMMSMSDTHWEAFVASAGPIDLESIPQDWNWT